MRLIVMGQQAFGKDVLAKLIETGTDEVVAVYCEPDKEGKPADPIKDYALELGLPVEQPANFDDQATLDTLAAFNAAVAGIGEIEQAHMIAGNFDYLLKIRTGDMAAYRAVLAEKISTLPHVASTSTYMAMQAVKEDGATGLAKM